MGRVLEMGDWWRKDYRSARLVEGEAARVGYALFDDRRH